MHAGQSKTDTPVTSCPWFERLGAPSFAAGGAALGFAVSLLFVWNSSPIAENSPTPLVPAQPPLHRPEALIGRQPVRTPILTHGAGAQIELAREPLVTPSRPVPENKQSVSRTEISGPSGTVEGSDGVTGQEPPNVAVARSYQGSHVVQRDTATSGIDSGARRDNDFTRPTQANVVSTPGTAYRQSAPTHYRTTARSRYRSAYQTSSEDEKTVRPSESPLGTTATGIPTYVGPRGGVFHYSASGKKVYQRRR
jgi:hypothetical protein